ncbi:hypothetical protein [Naasia aerilata]|uniref:ABC transporter ATP-binding protein n=1 Tax=Naasia aerilata TaxID=1162966 RepID=A0ABN6XK88_9MICO|nr:hypothetical protein [Naasia aerilata]BDZ45352.1 hypothetical protein GCM10025866_12610 [Naasia aerilata]
MSTKPSRAERFRPAELLGLAMAFGLFAGLVVLITARDVTLGVIFFGVAFIVALIVLAMLALVVAPDLPPKGDDPQKPGTTPNDGPRAG